MSYRIVILTKQVEAPFLLQFIRKENPSLEVLIALNENELRRAVATKGADTRLISFNSHTIIPADILDSLGPVPYNIHPGPLNYPGTYPVAFALKDRANYYGVTAHEIIEKVDAGPIVYVEQVPIAADICLEQLTDLAFTMAVTAFSFIAQHCAVNTGAIPHLDYRWSGTKSTHESYKQLCQMPANASTKDQEQMRRICGEDLVLTQ